MEYNRQWVKRQGAFATGDDMAISYVYLFEADGGLFKIGKSNNPAQRLASFQRLPFNVRLIHTIESSAAGWLERVWHRKFKAKRCQGEWFRLSPADVSLFCRVKKLDKPRRRPDPQTDLIIATDLVTRKRISGLCYLVSSPGKKGPTVPVTPSEVVRAAILLLWRKHN